MRAMKDSGIAWIGEIPEEWKIVRNKNAFVCNKELVGEKSALTQLLSLTTRGIKKKDINNAEGKLPESFDTYQFVRENDIVMCLFDLDCSAVFSGISPIDGMISPAYRVLSCKECIEPRYADYWFRYISDGRKFNHFAKNIRYTLSYEEFSALPLLLPKKVEQHRIADYLDRKCSQIDAIIAWQQEVIEKLKTYKLSVITEAVTKGLNPHAPMKDSGVEWIGEIPEHWEVMKFGRCATIKSNLVAPDDYADYPQISPDSIEKNSGRIIDYKTVKEAGVISWNHLFFKGQVIYSKIRPMLNKVAIAPFDGLCSADMYPIETSNDTQFLVYLMLSDYFTSQVGLVTENRVKMPKINQNELSAIMVTIPPQSEQETISKYLSEKCASLDVAIDKKQGLIYKLNAYKKSLIYEVVTGKKEV